MSQTNDDSFIHVYAQSFWHDDACLVANEQALRQLKKAVEDALAVGMGSVEVFAGDGEGYKITVRKANDQDFDRLAVPYTDESAKEYRDDAVWPRR